MVTMHAIAFDFSQSKHSQMCKCLSKHENSLSEHEEGLNNLDHSKMYRKLFLSFSLIMYPGNSTHYHA